MNTSRRGPTFLAAALSLAAIAAAPAPPSPSADALGGRPGRSPLVDEILGGEAARPQQDPDPLRPIATDTAAIAVDLSAPRTDDPVQDKQRRVLGQLDRLIAQLEAECNSGGSGGSRNPSRPMTQSRIAGGPGGQGPLHDPKAGTRNWGQLPAKQREQILQSQNEGFPAGYESLLSSYYRRLAETNPAAAPTTNPATP